MPPVIEVSHVTKEYRLGALRIAGQLLNGLRERLAGRTPQQVPPFKALDDVSFSIERGEVVGIIGHNGAGKSTLLKMLARISTPTRGSVRVSGRIAPLIEVGAGFVPDFTGRENVYLNGAILGMSRKEIARKFDEIVDFAEMEQFIDTPVKRYSSGMQVKLAFAVATSIESEILIVDEVLAVGDLAFQRKCFDRVEDLIKRQGRTVLLVSHNIRQVERLCSRAILMDRGRVALDSTARHVCNRFFEESDRRIAENNRHAAATRSMSSGDVELVRVTIEDDKGHAVESVRHMEPMTVKLLLRVHRNLVNPAVGLGVHTTDFVYLATSHNPADTNPDLVSSGLHEWTCRIERMPFLPRAYALRIGVSAGARGDTIFYAENVAVFRVTGADTNRADPDALEGIVALETEWRTPAREPAVQP